MVAPLYDRHDANPHELILIILAIALVIGGLEIVQLDKRLALVESQAVTNLFVTTEAMKSVTDVKLLKQLVDNDSKLLLSMHEQLQSMQRRR